MSGPVATYEELDVPYFVYGTLRPAWGNSDIWRFREGECHHDGEAYVIGYQMIDHGIPYAVATGWHLDRVIGAVIVPPADLPLRLEMRWQLDGLEGHPEHYERVKCQVETPDGPIEAWIYTPTTWRPDGPVELTGDYANCGGLRPKVVRYL